MNLSPRHAFVRPFDDLEPVLPAKVAVPLPLSVKVTPPGSAPVSLKVVAAGKWWPVVTVKLPAVPTVNAAVLALVIAGASVTVRVKVWVALGATPLLAVIVTV